MHVNSSDCPKDIGEERKKGGERSSVARLYPEQAIGLKRVALDMSESEGRIVTVQEVLDQLIDDFLRREKRRHSRT